MPEQIFTDAQKKIRSKGTQIFPDSCSDSAETTNIDFDLAVTQTSNYSSAKLGAALGWLKAGISSDESRKIQRESRIYCVQSSLLKKASS